MQWQESTALMLASEEGHLDVVRELLRAEADVNAQDEVSSYSGEVRTSLVSRPEKEIRRIPSTICTVA